MSAPQDNEEVRCEGCDDKDHNPDYGTICEVRVCDMTGENLCHDGRGGFYCPECDDSDDECHACNICDEELIEDEQFKDETGRLLCKDCYDDERWTPEDDKWANDDLCLQLNHGWWLAQGKHPETTDDDWKLFQRVMKTEGYTEEDYHLLVDHLTKRDGRVDLVE